MKRQYLIGMLLVLTVPLLGCQNCLNRFRGARCRPGFSLPSLRWQRPPMEAPPCVDGCNAAGYVPDEGMAMSGMTTSDVVVGGFSSELSGAHVTERPVVTSRIVGAGGSDSVISVPGPEVAPLPGN